MPKSHVPVVVCRSAGIRTRGRSTAQERSAAGGEPAYPAKRGTRLKATTDRACLVSVGPSKGRLTEEACLSCRACGRDLLPSNRWLRNQGRPKGFSRGYVSNGAASDRAFDATRLQTRRAKNKRSRTAGQRRRIASPSRVAGRIASDPLSSLSARGLARGMPL